MTISKIYKIYFSPTGGTKKIVETIADKLQSLLCSHQEKAIESISFDFTLPKARLSFPNIEQNSLVVFGTPTYAGRVPNLLLKYLDTIEGNGALAIPVVTFGNRAFDNSLIELRDILERHYFRTIAAGAFCCQHSFSDTLAAGRPDEKDINYAKDFATNLFQKHFIIDNSSSQHDNCSHSPICLPGDLSQGYYQPRLGDGTPIDIRKVKPKTNENCNKCGHCADICPMGSISPTDYSLVDGICIKCCACIKQCPSNAKYFDDSGFLFHKSDLETRYSTRSENSVFI